MCSRLYLRHGADNHVVRRQIDESFDHGVGHYFRAASLHPFASFEHVAHYRVQVCRCWHLDIDNRVDELLGEVDHGLDLAVRNDDELAGFIANLGAADIDRLDASHGIADLHNIADEILILEQDEKARHDIADQVLRAQADRKA